MATFNLNQQRHAGCKEWRGGKREREREGYRVRYGATVRGRATQHPNKECKTKQRLQRWQDAGWI